MEFLLPLRAQRNHFNLRTTNATIFSATENGGFHSLCSRLSFSPEYENRYLGSVRKDGMHQFKGKAS